MLNLIKLALRITTDAFNTEIQLYIADCIAEMESLGVIVDKDSQTGAPTSDQVKSAVIAYCKWRFGSNDEADRWRDIYHEKLSQLKVTTGFTSWEA